MASDDASGTSVPTFAGRLRVADFMYRADDDSSGKRGRGAGSPSAVVSRVQRSSRSGPALSVTGKRKAGDPPADDEADNEADDDGRQENVPASASLSLLSPFPTERRTTANTAIPASPPASGTDSRRGRRSSKYAPPSTYAHLALLPDALAPNLLVLFVGLNPGVETARSGHAYAHPTNLFWRLLYRSGTTPVECRPEEDRSMPARFRLGLTNIVARPSRNGAELRAAELDDGVAVLEAKARRWRPEVVCIVGKGIWDSIVRVRLRQRRSAGLRQAASRPPPFHYGWQAESENMGRLNGGADDEKDTNDIADGVYADPAWKGARVFVATSTSGLAASLSLAEKETVWRELGVWVEQRRRELTEAEAEASSSSI